ncbi:MAG: class I SAM-dependent methyltransferase [Planctomycetota bacterium]
MATPLSRTPDWQLPPGVDRGTLDYAHSRAVAEQYDEYHEGNPLFDFEEQLLADEFSPPGVVADLGCGTGRALLPLVRAGHTGLAIDLSEEMLALVREKADYEGLAVRCVQANLVELEAVASESVDYAMCLFSTLGMIRGRSNRRAALGHMRRILRPGGKLVLHGHNFWFNLRDGSGPWWVLRSLGRAAVSKEIEVGDKWYPYRGVPNFFLHVYRARELRADLRAERLILRRWIPLDVSRRHALAKPRLLPSLRANGWLVVCQA